MTSNARLRRIAAALLALSAAILGGCAPRPTEVAELADRPLRARFEQRLAARVARMAAEADVNAWARGTKMPDLPGVQARLLLAAPDAFRLRVGSLFGTALDVSARGDSFTAWVPPKQMALDTRAAGDSLGLADPGVVGYRGWSGTWTPPDEAWNATTWVDTVRVLRWREGEAGDSLRLALGTHGLPHWIEVVRDGELRVRVDYKTWHAFDGTPWPSRIRIEDARGAYGLECRIQNLQFHARADRARLAVQIPDDARRVTRADLQNAIERMSKI